MKKIALIGFFNYGVQDIGGGVMKTRNYEKILRKKYGQERIVTLDRLEGKNNPILYLFHFIKIMFTASSILIFPTAKMLKTFFPILIIGKKIFHYKILYIVIGGWLPDLTDSDVRVRKLLKKIDGIYVETEQMKKHLIFNDNLSNVECVPNFSMRKMSEAPYKYEVGDFHEFRFCTYSRVIKEKGIPDAIQAIREISQETKEIKLKLDIYGQVWPEYEKEFEELLKKNEKWVSYKGVLDEQNAIPELEKHYMLLFPTYYKGEGFPGTLVESLMAGLPAIVSDWKYNSEIIHSDITGYVYSLEDDEGLKKEILKSISNYDSVIRMRSNCIEEAKKYKPEAIIEPICRMIGQGE